MRAFTQLSLTLGLVGAGVATGCNPFHRAKVQPPVFVAPPPSPPKPPEPLEQPPVLASMTEELPNLVFPGSELPRLAPPPAPRPPAPKTPAAASPKPQDPPAAAQPPAGPPQLSLILAPAEQQKLNSEIDAGVASVNRYLARIQGRILSNEQRLTWERIGAFLKQAQQTRQTDLITARSLVHSADVLAEDLVRALQ